MKWFSFNAELQRNVWLEISLAKMVIIPIIFIGVVFVSKSNTFLNTAGLIGGFGVIFTLFYGNLKATNGIIDELNSGTWVLQRLTPISPWKMVIGKIFGPTIAAWYASFICLFLLLALAAFTSFQNDFYNVILLYYAIFLVSTVGIYAINILHTLYRVNRLDLGLKVKPILYYIIGIAWSLVILVPILFILQGKLYELKSGDVSMQLSWYGIAIDVTLLFFLLVVYFVAWSVYGLRNVMGTLFMERQTVYPLIAFLLSTTFLLAGFIFFNSGNSISSETVFRYYQVSNTTWLGTLLFTCLFLEDKSAGHIHGLVSKIQYQPKNWVYNLPSWLIVLVFIILFIPIIELLKQVMDINTQVEVVDRVVDNFQVFNQIGSGFTTLINALNITVIFIFFGLKFRPGRAEPFAMGYLFFHGLFFTPLSLIIIRVLSLNEENIVNVQLFTTGLETAVFAFLVYSQYQNIDKRLAIN